MLIRRLLSVVLVVVLHGTGTAPAAQASDVLAYGDEAHVLLSTDVRHGVECQRLTFVDDQHLRYTYDDTNDLASASEGHARRIADSPVGLRAGHAPQAGGMRLRPCDELFAPNSAEARFVAGSDGVVVDVLGGSPNAVVLGKYPAYVNQGAVTGARTFSMSDDAWNALSPAEQWARDQQFLDDAISRGSEIHLATDLTPSNLTGFSAREIEYLSKQGYVPDASGTQMVKGG